MDKITIQGTRDWNSYKLRNACSNELNRMYAGIITKHNDAGLKLAQERQLELLSQYSLTLIPYPYGGQPIVFREAEQAGAVEFGEAQKYAHLREEQHQKLHHFCDLLNKNYERRSYNFVLTDLPELQVFFNDFSPSNKYYVRNNSRRSIVTVSEHWTNFFNIIGELTL